MVPVKSFMVPIEKFISVDRDTTVRKAAERMRDCGIGSVFVTTGEEIIGILTDADLVKRVVAAGANPEQTAVEKVMSAPVLTIEGDKTLLDANDLMAREKCPALRSHAERKIDWDDFGPRFGGFPHQFAPKVRKTIRLIFLFT